MPGNIRHLQAMTRRLEHLLGMHRMEQNRLETADIAIIPFIDTVLATLNIELKATRQAIRAHVDLCPIGYNDPSLKQRSHLLESIPGTSPATIPYLLVAMSPNHGYPTPNNSSPMPDLPLPSASPDNGKAKPDLPKTATPDCVRSFICQL